MRGAASDKSNVLVFKDYIRSRVFNKVIKLWLLVFSLAPRVHSPILDCKTGDLLSSAHTSQLSFIAGLLNLLGDKGGRIISVNFIITLA